MSTETRLQKGEDRKLQTSHRNEDAFSRWEHSMERIFDQLWHRPFLTPWLPERWWTSRPLAHLSLVDLYEEKDQVVVKAEVPGLSKDELEVNLTDSTLTIRGEKKTQEDVRDEDYQYRERSHGAFSRSIELPAQVKTDQVTASFKDGILEVRLPKTEDAKRKNVNVKIA
jgi:HSP20 family protein